MVVDIGRIKESMNIVLEEFTTLLKNMMRIFVTIYNPLHRLRT